MIDRLELIVPVFTPQQTEFWNRHTTRKPAKRGSPYLWTVDARKDRALSVHYGHRDRIAPAKQHYKIDFTDTRLLTAVDLTSRVHELFRMAPEDAMSLKVARIDFAADLYGTPVEWFKEHSRVHKKRYSKTYEDQQTETVKGITSILFGKAPDQYRIYDRLAEKRANKKDVVLHDWGSKRLTLVVTRVERQCNRKVIPNCLSTLGALLDNAVNFDPFKNLVLTATHSMPSTDTWTPQRWLMSLGLACAVHQHGETAVRSRLNKTRNAKRIFDQYSELLGSGALGPTRELLVRLYRNTTRRQLNVPSRGANGELVYPLDGLMWTL